MNKKNRFNCEYAKVELGSEIRCEEGIVPIVVSEEAYEECNAHSDKAKEQES